MKSHRIIQRTKKTFRNISAPIRKSWSQHKAWQRFRKSLILYRSLHDIQQKATNQHYPLVLYPCIWDATSQTPIEPTYFYQDCWAFDLIANAKPASHVDIGSHHKYVGLLSKVVNLTMVDLRPLSLEMESIKFIAGSILDLPFANKSIESLSSLCVIEHIGLGRYGDPLDPLGSIKACQELSRVMKQGGSIYISVPVEERPKVYFNAHRSFDEDEFLCLFSEFRLQDKAYIYGSTFTRIKRSSFGIGCYHLVKSFDV